MAKQTEQTNTESKSVTKEQSICADKTTNVSQKIRALSALGHKPGPIVKLLTESGYKTKNGTDIRFQHVRNVLKTPVKKTEG